MLAHLKIWLTGKGARDATASKKNGAANVRKIWRRYHKIFRSRCPGGICTNTEMRDIEEEEEEEMRDILREVRFPTHLLLDIHGSWGT